MKKILLLLTISFLIFSNISRAQILTLTPELPTASDEVVVVFDASQGNKGLMDFTGDIYAHTGVITNKSSSTSDWKYVIANWGENTEKAKLTNLGNNKWELRISPSIREFYDVPANEQIEQLAFVFRSSDGSAQGKGDGNADIFYDVHQEGLSLGIISPENGGFVGLDQEIQIDLSANGATNLQLFINGSEVTSSTSQSINHTYTVASYGYHWIKAVASSGDESIADSVYLYTIKESNVAALPSNDLVDGINYIDDNTASLVLFAPGKENIFVIGDFANWEINEDYQMNKTPNGERFWLTLNNLEKGKEYIFQYLIDGELKTADPYSEKISEPWNDKYITDDTYPDLIQYPDGKTTGIASVLQTGQEEYTWEVPDFNAPTKTDLVIYELLIRDWTDNSNLQTVLDSLDYLENLGINAIELMPINEFEGNDSWGYNPSFYFATDKYYGTKDDYKRFIDECHKRGIAVIVDMVYNHSYGQSPFVRMYFEDSAPSADNPWYNQSCPHSTWCWGYDFNHESEHTKTLIDRINHYWLTEFKVDGFRFDFTKGFTNKPDPNAWDYDQSRIDILTRMADEIWAVNSNAYVILEHLTDNSEEKILVDKGMMMWGNMNHNYSNAAMGYDNDSDLSWASYKKRDWSQPNLIAYMESHDEERMMYRLLNKGNSKGDYSTKDFNTAIQRVELSAALFFTIPGPKMIWQFGELGYDYGIDFNGRVGRKPVKWDYFEDPYRHRLYKVFSSLIKLKTQNEAFASEQFTTKLNGSMKSIVIEHESMDVVVVGNFGLEAAEVNIDFTKEGKWFEFFTGNEMDVENTEQTISLAAGEYRIYTSKNIGKADIPAIPEPVLTVSPDGFEANDQVEIKIDMNAFGNFEEDLYMWFKKPEYTQNGTWENSDESLKMQNNSDGTYSFTVSPSLAEFFNVEAAAMRDFSFQVKTKNGSWSSIEYKRNPYIEFTDPVITYTPEGVNSNKEVTMHVDLSTVDYPGGDMYFWFWDPEPSIKNGEWNNSNEALKLNNLGGGKYSYVFGPSIAEYYGVDAEELKEFNFLLKVKDGSWKTADYKQEVGSSITGIKTNELHGIVAYPNPVKDVLYIKHLPINAKIEIFDLYGRKMFESNQDVKQINVSKYNSGIYFLKITNNKNEVETVKFQIVK